MIIPIRLPSELSQREDKLPPVFATLSSNETMIIELQGSFEIEGDYEDQVIATLDASNLNKPILRVGHHLLEGKLATLPKPLAILKQNSINTENTSQVSFDMVAIIRKKIVFSKRPSPIVGQVINEEGKESSKRKRAA